MKGIKLKELLELCRVHVDAGNGDKTVLISCDDEGNGFHTLFYGIESDIENIRKLKEVCGFHDNNDPEDVVVLG